MQNIKNIVFDLGGVIIDIDVPTTFENFALASQKTTDEVTQLFINNLLFERHETGNLSDEAFRIEIIRLLDLPENYEQIDQVWNTLLLAIPVERIELIRLLSKKYRVFLLSNTNHIHYVEVENILHKATGIKSFDDLFEKVYLSYQIGLRKPHAPIYEHVLLDSKLIPAETLFIDDNSDNILGASALGIQTIHIQFPNTILDHLKAYV
jgi:putative hydrolase of the HAD superfamily